MTATSAQRYNARMERIFAEGRANSIRHAPLHAVQILEQMTEKVERVNAVLDSGGNVGMEDWPELRKLAYRARSVLENIKLGKGQT